MSLHLISSEQLRTSCRQRLESCELWLRRLVHDTLSPIFGDKYIETANINGQLVFRAQIRDHVKMRLSAGSSVYSRPIDTLLLDDLASVICRDDIFRQYFRKVFLTEFPIGSTHLRLVMMRLVPIRNALAHANPLSIHDAERALCYSDDIISALANYYEALGMSQEFNSPSFTRFSDSLGNVSHVGATSDHLDFSKTTSLRPGESIRCEVEVDAHFDPSEYIVKWDVANISSGEKGVGSAFSLVLQEKHVSVSFEILVTIKSNKGWHRHGNYDSILVVVYRVLPPIL